MKNQSRGKNGQFTKGSPLESFVGMSLLATIVLVLLAYIINN